MDDGTLFFIIAAVLFGVAALVDALAVSVARVGFLIPAGLLCLALGFIVERH